MSDEEQSPEGSLCVLSELSMESIYKEIDVDANIFEIDGVTYKGRKHKNPLHRMERFVLDVISDKVDIRHGKPVLPTLKLQHYMTQFNAYISQYDEKYEYSELVSLFFSICNEMRLTFGVFQGRGLLIPDPPYEGRELFNEFVMRIRAAAERPDFKKRQYARVHNSVRNLKSAKEYVCGLFERHSRLLVLRIDFGYTVDAAQSVTVEDAHADRVKFLNNRRSNSIFASLLGYVWKLECGEEKGHHFHFMFFYDGAAVHKDGYLANKIGKYWNSLVSNRGGVFHNCNSSKGKYKRCGIGMISHFDAAKRENLLLALQYLTKKDQYLRVKSLSRSRVFGRGEMPCKRTSGPGRPRRAR